MLHYLPSRLYQLTELSLGCKLKVIPKHCEHYYYNIPTMLRDENIFLTYLFFICIFSSISALSTHLDHCLYGQYFCYLFSFWVWTPFTHKDHQLFVCCTWYKHFNFVLLFFTLVKFCIPSILQVDFELASLFLDDCSFCFKAKKSISSGDQITILFSPLR